MRDEVFIVDGIRTPIGKIKGSLSSVRADDLAAMVIRELMNRNGQVPAEKIDDVILGCANQAGEDNRNVARMAVLLAGLPHTVPGETVNRLCASGMSAIVQAARAIQTGDADLMVAGGVEHMTRAPYVFSKATESFGNDVQLYDSSFGWRFINPLMKEKYGIDVMGETAENLVDMYKISREAQDAFSYQSQMKAAKATARLSTEIMPVRIPVKKADDLLFAEDEFVKPFTTLEGLAKLKPAFRKNNGTVTAGNSSGLNDGAAAVLLASGKALKEFQLMPKARIVSSAVVGVEPRVMGIGPVEASRRALEKSGLRLEDMDIIELNEAFAAQVLACLHEWKIDANDPRLNVNGGAIALGHPLGMTGARITYSAALDLHERNGRYALATLCIGVGQEYAVVLEKV